MIELVGMDMPKVFALIEAEGQRYGIDISTVRAASPGAFSVRIEYGYTSCLSVRDGESFAAFSNFHYQFEQTFYASSKRVDFIIIAEQKESLIIRLNNQKFSALFASERGRLSLAIFIVAWMRKLNLN